MAGIQTYPTRQEASDITRPTASAAARAARPGSRPKSKIPVSPKADENKRQKVMTALIPILAVTLVLVLKNPLKVSPAAEAQNATSNIAAGPVSSDIEIAWEIPPLYASDSRDPMRLPALPAPTVEEPAPGPAQTHVGLMVKGILYSEDRPAALVDTQLVREGQQIAGATVRRIERDGVVFEMDGRTWKQAVDK